MARTDAIVLGAGIVGTSIALHLAKRGLSVALVDRRGPGEETSYGNAGVIEGNTLFPHPFPRDFGALLRVALKQAPEANYHLSFLPQIAPWLLAYRANSSPERRLEFAKLMRPLFAARGRRARGADDGGGRDALSAQGRLAQALSQRGGVCATPRANAMWRRSSASSIACSIRDAARALEPSLSPVFHRAVHWPDAASVINPLAVTRAYAARFKALGGFMLTGDARSLRRDGGRWRVDAEEGPVDTANVVVALGPWAPDVLEPLGIRLPLAVKRGYHRHFRPQGNAGLTPPGGRCRGRLLPGADGAGHPAHHRRGIRRRATRRRRRCSSTGCCRRRRGCFRWARRSRRTPWMGSRPCFADSRPVIGRAPGQDGLWLAYGHAHWGLTLGPVTGRLVAEMMTGETPFCDPAPYRAERFAH